MSSFLSKEATVAGPGFTRWLVPPAAIAVQMCVGQIYAFNVFNVPLTKACGWTIPQVGWIYSIALFMLGMAAAVLGKRVEAGGPRRAMVASALCFCGGLAVAALGVYAKQLWLLYLGYGVIGGIGLGLGYLAPVSTLMRWFPDRPGMATGMAIMGFGGGMLIGAPLAVSLMERFKTTPTGGVGEAMLVMAGLYFVSMGFGALLIRVPPPGWQPAGWTPPLVAGRWITSAAVSVDQAWKTPQFWLLWLVLCLNVSAGIGIIGQASKMCMDMFGVSAAVGGGFAGLLGIFNMGGRFVWSSASDRLGRKRTFAVFFTLGAVLFCLIPWTRQIGSRGLFMAVTALIISMYGGGFATMPAYLRDLFGTAQVGQILGRVITAWSVAALVGPMLVNYISTSRINAGVPAAAAYDSTMYLMAGLLVLGLAANLLVRPVHPKHHLGQPH
jgi:MFS family permease